MASRRLASALPRGSVVGVERLVAHTLAVCWCVAQSIDKRVWMSWYKEISALRGALRSATLSTTTSSSSSSLDERKVKTIADKLERVLAASAAFYSDLVDALQKRQSESESERRATLVSLHLCLVALGDIARYAEKAAAPSSSSSPVHEPDWTAAQQRYEQALRVLPSNGKVYNQLAFLAIRHHQALRAVYLFARSQACETPFQSRENLVQALTRGHATTNDADADATVTEDVQDRVELLFLLSLVPLFKTKASSREYSFQARANMLLGGLAFYLETRTTAMLFAGATVDLDAVRTVLSQCVSVVVFLVHDFQVRRLVSRVCFSGGTAGTQY